MASGSVFAYYASLPITRGYFSGVRVNDSLIIGT